MKFIKKMKELLNSKKEETEERIYILDTCALHSNEAMQIIEEASKVIILTGTIRELDKYKNDYSSFGDNIRTFCKKSRLDQNGDKYVCVSGYEKHDYKEEDNKKYVVLDKYEKYIYQDDNIIEYCRKHKNVIILTCDNNLCNMAKAYGISYIFPKRDEKEKTEVDNTSIVKEEVVETKTAQKVNIRGIKFENDNLYITNENANRFYLVIRNGIPINANSAKKRKLEVGDHVFKIKMKNENVIIVAYKIIEISPSMHAIEIINAKVAMQEIEELNEDKFPKEVKEKAKSLLEGKKQERNVNTKTVNKDGTKTAKKSNEQEILFENRWIRVQKSNQYAYYINVVRQGKLIKTQDYAVGDSIYLSKYNKKQNSLEIHVYKIGMKNNQYVAEKLDEYKLWLVNEIYNIKLSEELQDEIRSFFVKYARY